MRADLKVKIEIGPVSSEQLEVLEMIAHEMEVANRPPGPDQLRNELRRRTAERLYVGRLIVLATHQPTGILPDDQLTEIAAHAWHAASLLADADLERIWALTGEYDFATSSSPPRPDRPAAADPVTATPQADDF